MIKIFVAILVWLLLTSMAYANTYWLIGGDTTHVWSLDGNGLVLTTDSEYVNWLAAGNLPLRVASTSELYGVISTSYHTHLAASAQALESAGGLSPTQSFEWRKAAGLNITYTGAASLTGLYIVGDDRMTNLMIGALVRCGPNHAFDNCGFSFPFGQTTVQYLDQNLVAHTFSIPQMQVVFEALQDYEASLYNQLRVGLSGGTPSWPTNSVTVP